MEMGAQAWGTKNTQKANRASWLAGSGHQLLTALSSSFSTQKNNGHSQVPFCLESSGRAYGARTLGGQSLVCKEAAWVQRPLSAALGTDVQEASDTCGQTEIAFNVMLLVDIDTPFHLLIKTKNPKGKS